MIDFVNRVVISAVEITAQKFVARITLRLHQMNHPAHGHAHQGQGVAGQHQTALNRLRHHFGSAGGLQFFNVPVVNRAHNHRHPGCVSANIGQHLQCAGCVQVGHHHSAGTRQSGGHQRRRPDCVAKHHRLAGGGGLAHTVRVQVERNIWNVFGVEHAAQVLAATAITANDHVFVGVDGLACNAGHLQRRL